MRTLHIVPATPPAFNGLGDYARMLHRHWPEPRPEWHVAALRVTEGAEEAWPNVIFHEFKPGTGSLSSILRTAGCETVALHYVPHGYHPKGVPAWLPDELAGWKRSSGGRLVTFFHELFAFSPPWRTAFWLAPSSIRILREVVKLTDVALTSNDLYAGQLRVYGGLASPAEVLPIGSNVRVHERAATPEEGPWRIAVFGTARTRAVALRAHRPLLRLLAQRGEVSTLVLIGSGSSEEGADGLFQVECIKDASEEEVSRALASCHFGLVATDEARIFKSGVFAAYCAHGVVPIINGVRSEVPYLATSFRDPEAVATAMGELGREAELRDRVRAHAARSDWSVIAAQWAATSVIPDAPLPASP